MDAALRRSFEHLQRQKVDLLTDLSAWPEAAQRFRLSAGSWSGLQILDHLIKVEEGLLNDVKANLPGGYRIGIKDLLGSVLVISIMNSPMRVSVPPSQSSMMPDGDCDLFLLTYRWSATREQLGELLEKLMPEQFHVGLFRHPIFGWMTMARSLALLRAHLHHHLRQFSRLKRAYVTV